MKLEKLTYDFLAGFTLGAVLEPLLDSADHQLSKDIVDTVVAGSGYFAGSYLVSKKVEKTPVKNSLLSGVSAGAGYFLGQLIYHLG